MNIKQPFRQEQYRPNFQNQYRGRQYNPANYPNKSVDDNTMRNFLGILLSGSLGEISDFLMANNILLSNIKDANNDSPLHIILKDSSLNENKKLEICSYLINKGANVNAYDRNDMTPIHIASQLQLGDVLKLLLSKGGNVNSLNNVQQNPLHVAVKLASTL